MRKAGTMKEQASAELDLMGRMGASGSETSGQWIDRVAYTQSLLQTRL